VETEEGGPGPTPAVGRASGGAYARYAEIYDRLWSRAPYGRFVDLCLEGVPPDARPPRRVLVAACGTANAAIEFARRGHPVTGFDLSREMLAAAAAKRRSGAIPVGLVRADLRAVPFAGASADLIVLLNTGINYLLQPGEVVAALGQLARVAGPDGTVVVEPLSSRYLHAGVEANRHLDAEDLRFDAAYSLHGDLVAERLRWSAGGAEVAETYWQRFYRDDDLAEMFASAGLAVRERRPMYPAIPEDPARGRVLWVATA
jgi:ubiquinone/menaquinone biosynthesis C-methylase UbiE